MRSIKNKFTANIPVLNLRSWKPILCAFLAINLTMGPVLAQLIPVLPIQGVQINVPGPMETQVNTFNGNLYYSRTDLTIPGRGLPLEIKLAYNSGQMNIDNGFGSGWDFSYDLHYSQDGNDIIIKRGDGREDKYIRSGDAFIKPLGISDTLEEYVPNQFRVTSPDGIQTFFDSQDHKHVTSIRDTNGNSLTFTYNGSGQLTTITDTSGRQLYLTYTNDHLTTLTDPNTTPNRTMQFQYDGSYNLISITDLGGNTTTYGYSGNLLNSITDPRGNTATIDYTESSPGSGKLVVSNISTDLTSKSFDYDENSRTTTVTDVVENEDQVTRYVYDSQGRISSIENGLGHSVSMAWDDKNNLVSSTDEEGHTTSYTYDENNNILTVTNPLDKVTTYTYDDIFNKITSIKDAKGSTTTYEYDSKGNLIKTFDPLGNKTTFTYDDYGDLIRKENANNQITTMTHNNNGDLASIKDPLGHTTSFIYDSVGNAITMTDANGNTLAFSYDMLNRMTSIINALGQETSITYDANGNKHSITNPKGSSIGYAYDELNRLIQVTDALGNKTKYSYNQMDKLRTIEDANGHTTNFTFDKANRLKNEIDSESNIINYDYDKAGNLISRFDANGILSFTYDEANRRTSIEQNQQIVNNKVDFVVTGTSFDPTPASDVLRAGTLTITAKLTNKSASAISETLHLIVHSLEYSGFTAPPEHIQLISADDFDGVRGGGKGSRQTITVRPDGVLNPNESILVEFDIGLRNRAPFRFFVDVGGHIANNNSATYSYDNIGNLTGMSNSDVSVSQAYDATNRLTGINVNVLSEGINKSIGYTYDAVGNRKTMDDPDGGVTTYTYDIANRLINLVNPALETTSFTYDNANRLIRQGYHNGTYALHTYDIADQLLSIIHKDSAGTTLFGHFYEYDTTGNRLHMTDESGSITKYNYDDLDRLLGMTYPDGTTASYAYDAVGNRTKLIDNTGTTYYTYDRANRLLSAGTQNYNWDNNGNQISKVVGADTMTYNYDGLNRLTSITVPDGSTKRFSYYPDGRRLSTTDHVGKTTYNFYDGPSTLVKTDSIGMTIARYTSGRNVDQWISLEREGIKSYYHQDGLNSIVGLTDTSESIAATYQYDAFGTTTSETGNIVNPFRYTGRQLEQKSGLYDYRSRFYDAEVGRFLTKDLLLGILEVPDTTNQYTYVMNKPITLIDPFGFGFFKRLVSGVVGAVTGGVVGAIGGAVIGAAVGAAAGVAAGPVGILAGAIGGAATGAAVGAAVGAVGGGIAGFTAGPKKTGEVVKPIGYALMSLGGVLASRETVKSDNNGEGDGEDEDSGITIAGVKITPGLIGGAGLLLVAAGDFLIKIAGEEENEQDKTQGNTGGSYKSGGGGPGPTITTSFTVNSTSDTVDANIGDGVCADSQGNCTLRAAIQETNALSGINTINVPAGTYTLAISGLDEDGAVTGDLDITDDLTIIGVGAATTIIDGGGLDRVLHVLGAGLTPTVDIFGVTIRNGSEFQGGGILNAGGTVWLINSSIDGNRATPSDGDGGGILNDEGTVWLINSTVSGNTAGFGTGISNRTDGSRRGGTVRLINSTVSGNVAVIPAGSGPVIFNSDGGTVILTNSTIGPNTSGIDNANGTFQLSNTIVAAQLSGSGCTRGSFTSLGHNLDQDDSCNLSNPTDIIDQDPLLGLLQNNGGPTETHAIMPGSPAIDAVPIANCTFDDDGDPATPEVPLTIDQRGVVRPQGAACDIGAYEFP